MNEISVWNVTVLNGDFFVEKEKVLFIGLVVWIIRVEDATEEECQVKSIEVFTMF